MGENGIGYRSIFKCIVISKCIKKSDDPEQHGIFKSFYLRDFFPVMFMRQDYPLNNQRHYNRVKDQDMNCNARKPYDNSERAPQEYGKQDIDGSSCLCQQCLSLSADTISLHLWHLHTSVGINSEG